MSRKYRRDVAGHLIQGKVVQHETLLCRAADWPGIKHDLGLGQEWAELRLGKFMVASGPPCSDAIPRPTRVE